jgi:hypothetical protein
MREEKTGEGASPLLGRNDAVSIALQEQKSAQGRSERGVYAASTPKPKGASISVLNILNYQSLFGSTEICANSRNSRQNPSPIRVHLCPSVVKMLLSASFRPRGENLGEGETEQTELPSIIDSPQRAVTSATTKPKATPSEGFFHQQ